MKQSERIRNTEGTTLGGAPWQRFAGRCLSARRLSAHHLSALARSALPLLAALCTLGCSVELLHDLDEVQANVALATLQKNGVDAAKNRVAQGSGSTYMIDVPKSQAPKAWQVLREHNLPRRRSDGLGEVFGKSTLVPTAAQQQALMRHALSGEITRTLESIDGVSEARVHVVLPRRDPLAPPDREPPQPRASVLLKVRPDATLSEAEIKRLVSGGIATMSPEAVQVVITRTHALQKSAKRAAVGTAFVGPFQVAIHSRAALVATLIAAVVLILGLGLGLLLVWLKLLSARREQAQASIHHSPDLEASLSLIGRSMHTRSQYTQK